MSKICMLYVVEELGNHQVAQRAVGDTAHDSLKPAMPASVGVTLLGAMFCDGVTRFCDGVTRCIGRVANVGSFWCNAAVKQLSAA